MRRCTSRAPGLPHHADDLTAGGSAHDGIVDQNDALAFEQTAHRIELELHAEIANGLRRLDERAAHVVIADQSLAIRQTGFGGVTERGGIAGIGHRHHDIGIGGSFAGQQTAHQLARILYRAAEHDGIGAREIDVLEDALRDAVPRARSARE